MLKTELKEIETIIKDTAYAVQQASKSENSGLIGQINRNIATLQSNHIEVMARLDKIEIQTTKTNGTVIGLRLWRSLQMGGLAVIVAVVIPLIVYIFTFQIAQVQAEVSKLEQLK